MVTGYGRWALALSAQLLVPMVFVMGLPRAGLAQAFDDEAIFAAGGLLYIGLALIATQLSGANDRRLMASECFRELAAYLRAIARFTDPAIDATEVYGAAIRQQAALAEQLQAARALLLERPRATPERVRLAATIGILLDAFDALVAAQCDLPRLRGVVRGADLYGAHRRRLARRRARSAASQPRIADQRQAGFAARPCRGDQRHASRGARASSRARRRARPSAPRSRRRCSVSSTPADISAASSAP